MRIDIDNKYIEQANGLEAEFFNIIDKGLPSQHRELKPGESIEEFNLRHGNIWRNHEAELIANGYFEPEPEPEPPRDPIKELDDLKAELRTQGVIQ